MPSPAQGLDSLLKALAGQHGFCLGQFTGRGYDAIAT
jgi:hypothetical protein